MAQGGALIRPDEHAQVRWSFALFFCVFASWYSLRPLRDALGLAGGVRELSNLFAATLGASFVVAPALSAVMSRFARRTSLIVAYRALAFSLLVFFALLRRVPSDPGAARSFFVWASVLCLAEITLAWALMADVFTREQGVRLFAFIGAGGTVGAMVGSFAAALLARWVGPAATLLVGAALLEAAVRCVDRIGSSAPHVRGLDRPSPSGGAFGWLAPMISDPFFVAICAYLALFTFSSTVLYVEQARIVKAAMATTAERTELFARMDLSVNALTLVLQLFVVGSIIRRIGVGLALAALPVLTLACFGAIRIAPVLAVLVVCQVTRRALDFAVTRPAREVLFTVVRPEDKYRAKTFIDTFVYRSGDALAGLSADRLVGPLLVAAMVIACTAWMLLGLALGRARPRSTGGVI